MAWRHFFAFVTKPHEKRSPVFTWIMGLCALPCTAALLAECAVLIKEMRGIKCSTTSTDWMNLILSSISTFLLLTLLLSTGPTKYLRFLPFSHFTHILLTLAIVSLTSITLSKAETPCSTICKICPRESPAMTYRKDTFFGPDSPFYGRETQDFKWEGKRCECLDTLGQFAGEDRSVDLIHRRGIGAGLEKRRGGGGGHGRGKNNRSKVEDNRFVVAICLIVAISTYLLFALISVWADVENKKKVERGEEPDTQTEPWSKEHAEEWKSFVEKVDNNVFTWTKVKKNDGSKPGEDATATGASKETVSTEVNVVEVKGI